MLVLSRSAFMTNFEAANLNSITWNGLFGNKSMVRNSFPQPSAILLKPISEQKVHTHTEASVKRCDTSIQQLARSYNELCNKIYKHICDGHAPIESVYPSRIDSKGLFALDVDDDIWQDTGLGDEGDQNANPPLWLCNANVRKGIGALLELDRCQEEEARLQHERRAMQEWFSEEWQVIVEAYEATGSPFFLPL